MSIKKNVPSLDYQPNALTKSKSLEVKITLSRISRNMNA